MVISSFRDTILMIEASDKIESNRKVLPVDVRAHCYFLQQFHQNLNIEYLNCEFCFGHLFEALAVVWIDETRAHRKLFKRGSK